MIVRTEAIVLTAVKYAEADLIVSCYTRETGLKSYLLRNILKSKRGKLKTSYFQPLTQLQLEAFHKDKGTLERIRDAQLAYAYVSMHTDVVKSAVTLFLAEVLKGIIKEEEPNEALFEYLQKALIWLDQQAQIANFPIIFLLKLSEYLGFYPDVEDAHLPYFNMLEGTFQSHEHGLHVQTKEELECMLPFTSLNWEQASELQLPKEQRKNALRWLLMYYQLHIENFRQPRSLEVLQTVFAS